jgi:hypothetical protein
MRPRSLFAICYVVRILLTSGHVINLSGWVDDVLLLRGRLVVANQAAI